MKALLIFFFLPLQLLAQDLTGVWTGSLQSPGSTMPYEVVISGSQDKLGGYAMTTFIFDGSENIGVKTISLKVKKSSILLEDDELVYHNYTKPPKRQKLLGNLTLTVQGERMMLSGTFTTRSLDFRSQETYSGTIQLRKQNDPAPTKLMAKLDELKLTDALTFVPPKAKEKEGPGAATVAAAQPVLKEEKAVSQVPPAQAAPIPLKEPKTVVAQPLVEKEAPPEPVLPQQKRQETLASLRDVKRSAPDVSGMQRRGTGAAPSPALTAARAALAPAADVENRRTEIVSSVAVASDSLILSLYDNGEIDGDTVSVLLNEKVIIAQKGLTATALRTTIYLTPDMGDSLRLTLYAENLGRLAPNTGLLVVQDGAERHEIRFAGDFQRNSAIILRRKR